MPTSRNGSVGIAPGDRDSQKPGRCAKAAVANMDQLHNSNPLTMRRPALSHGDIHLWLLDLDEHPEFQRDHYALLPHDERIRADRMATEALFARHVAAHGCLRLVLADYLGVPPASIEFVLSANGKPRLSSALGSRLSFNLSHSEGVAIIGITSRAEIGVDTEGLRPLPDRLAIARNSFTLSESSQLAAMTDADSTLAFLRCWTLKEAFVKATGDGLSIPLNSFEISMDPESPPRLLYLSGGSPADWSFHYFEPRTGYLAAAAVLGPVNAWVQLSWSRPPRSPSTK
jgi:4'-phosphopantetheinyl transferase